MANIVINSNCNLNCPYCFAKPCLTDNDQITIEEVDRIINFLTKDTCQLNVGIIGGEPTLHPLFEDIINFIYEKGCSQNKKPSIVIFSNGIELHKHIDVLTKAEVLLNINSPEIIGSKNWANIIKTLVMCKAKNYMDKVTLGINLYKDIPDFSYIFDLARDFGIEILRCSCVCPTSDKDFKNKENYYYNLLSIYEKFLTTAKIYGIKIKLDCNHIPDCYLSDYSLQLQNDIVVNKRPFCSPVVDIYPDMTASCCFGVGGKTDITKFNCLKEVERYFSFGEIHNLTLKNINCERCSKCEKSELFQCQGGCLAFTHSTN